jgi:hypothetical protein
LGLVGIDTEFTILDDEKIKPHLDAIEGDTRATNAGQEDPKDDDNFPRPPLPTEPAVTVLMESMEH